MFFNVIVTLLVGLLLALGVGVVSAVVLGLGTLLALVFRVSVFEASLVVLAVVAGVLWFVSTLVANRAMIEVEEEPEPAEEIHRWLEAMPLPPARGGKRKRH